jgi:CheY-like chemotaxis protein
MVDEKLISRRDQVETLLALSSQKKTLEFSKRINRQVTRVSNIKALLKRLSEDDPALVIVDITLPSLVGQQLIDQLRGKIRGDLLVLVEDLASFDPHRLSAALEASAENKPAGRSSPLQLMPELHDPENGRIDARRVADFLGLSLTKLAKSLGRSPQSVHKTPDSIRLQDKLGLFLRLASGLNALFGTEGNGKIWLNSPNPDLDNTRPLDLIEQGKVEIVAELLEDSLLGHPG